MNWFVHTTASWVMVFIEAVAFMVWSIVERSAVLRLLLVPVLIIPVILIAVVADYYGYKSEDLL